MTKPPSSEVQQLTAAKQHFSSLPHYFILFQQPQSQTTAPLHFSLPFCRISKPENGNEDSLLAGTLCSPQTIPHALTYYHHNAPDSSSSEPQDPTTVTTLFDLGSGLNGHPDLLHGGIVCTLLDEGMGIFLNIIEALEHRKAIMALGKQDAETKVINTSAFTGELKVRFARPVRTTESGNGGLRPVVSVCCRQMKREGERKRFLRAEVRQWQRGGKDEKEVEVICAIGEAVFIKPRMSRL